jgi:hypothetical protein
MKKKEWKINMDKKFQNVKNQLLNETFNDIRFSENRKQNVIQHIRKNKSHYKEQRTYLFKNILSGFVCVGVATGLFIFGIEYIHPQDNSGTTTFKPSRLDSPNNNKQTEAMGNNFQEYDPIPDPGTLSKEDVQSRILSSHKYFETAAGSFTYEDAKQKYTVEYSVRLDEDQFGAYSAVINPKNEIEEITVVNGKDFIELYPKQEEYRMSGVMPFEKNSADRPMVGRAFHTLFHHEIANNYLKDYKRWDIIKQTDTLLGQKVIVVGGTLNSYNSEKHKANTFKLWVQKGTGIIMQLETYNNKGEISESYKTNEIILNKPVDLSKFVIEIPDNYQDAMEKYSHKIDPREKEVKQVAGAKTNQGDVKDVLKEIKEKVPFLYEFSNEDLKLFSGSLELYQGYYCASLYYMPISKTKSDGSNDSHIGIRAYPKESFVRNIDIFNNRDKAEQKSYRLNGFNWKVYTSEDGHWVTFISEREGIIYEVGTQNMTVKEVKENLQHLNQTK